MLKPVGVLLVVLLGQGNRTVLDGVYSEAQALRGKLKPVVILARPAAGHEFIHLNTPFFAQFPIGRGTERGERPAGRGTLGLRRDFFHGDLQEIR